MKNWLASLEEVRSLAGRLYPDFVYAPSPGPLSGRDVPVFMFHTLRADVFEEQMRYLAANAYHTPTLDAFYGFLARGEPLPPSSVLLTFDDVERGLLTAGVPLLKRYGFRCAAFLVPGRIEAASRKERAGTGKAWPTWSDVRAMRDSGVVDIGSHSLNHARIFVGSRLTGFVSPDIFVDGLGLDAPLVRQGSRDDLLGDLGAPLFRVASRLGLRPRYFDDEAARAACVRLVREGGGPEFFRDPAWRRRLERRRRAMAAHEGVAGRWETPSEQRDAMAREMTVSRNMLEETIERPVLDFAYPWTEGSDLAIELSRAAGYRTNFWGPLRGARINRQGQDPFRVVRLKEDYLLRLPGHGRRTLIDVLRMKARRRRTLRDIY